MTGHRDHDGVDAAVRDEARRLRRARQQAARLRARQARLAVVVVLAALLTLAGAWRILVPAESGLASGLLDPQTETSLIAASSPGDDESADPLTPVFASYRTLQLFLPVLESDLTEIGYHQAAGAKALPIESYLPDADTEGASENRGTGRTSPEPGSDAGTAEEPRILGGTVLRMWRANRSGQPDTAVDVGAAPGSPVFAPVTGTVLEVKTYELYGHHEDIEIHIQPAGWPEIDLVIIHVTDPVVRTGDRVIGGVTQLASVRLLSDYINHQLGEYSVDPGDHIHMQLNRIEEPGVTLPAEES